MGFLSMERRYLRRLIYYYHGSVAKLTLGGIFLAMRVQTVPEADEVLKNPPLLRMYMLRLYTPPSTSLLILVRKASSTPRLAEMDSFHVLVESQYHWLPQYPILVWFPLSGSKHSMNECIPVRLVLTLGRVISAMSLHPPLVALEGSQNQAVKFVASVVSGMALVKKPYVTPGCQFKTRQVWAPDPSPPKVPFVTPGPMRLTVTVYSVGIYSGSSVTKPLQTEKRTFLSVGELTWMPMQPQLKPFAIQQLPTGSKPAGTQISLQQYLTFLAPLMPGEKLAEEPLLPQQKLLPSLSGTYERSASAPLTSKETTFPQPSWDPLKEVMI